MLPTNKTVPNNKKQTIKKIQIHLYTKTNYLVR